MFAVQVDMFLEKLLTEGKVSLNNTDINYKLIDYVNRAVTAVGGSNELARTIGVTKSQISWDRNGKRQHFLSADKSLEIEKPCIKVLKLHSNEIIETDIVRHLLQIDKKETRIALFEAFLTKYQKAAFFFFGL